MDSDRIRIYVIADSYQWHGFTEDPNQFSQILSTYVVTMANSIKENEYMVFSLTLERKDYEILKKNMYKRPKKTKLTLVKDGKDD